MRPLKTYKEYLNENLHGHYSYYGAGSLFPIVHKLASEGKTPKQLYTYLTTLGIDEERKLKVLSQVFVNESITEGLFEDDIDDIVNAETDDLTKGIDPADADQDEDVKKAIDKLKDGDDETSKEKESEDKTKDTEETESEKIEALKGALKDAEKLDKIKKILSESLELDLEGIEEEIVLNIFEYRNILEKMNPAERDKLKDADFVFPAKRSWPIHDEKHAKTALVWATWPQYKDQKKEIISAVLKKYPDLKGFGASRM